MIAVKTNLTSHRRNQLELYPESCVVEINLQPGKRVLLSVVYRPPDADMEDMETLNSFLDCLHSYHIKDKIIVGDFNLPRIDWTSNQYKPDSRPLEREFCDIVNTIFLQQLVNFPTRFTKEGIGNILDLVLLWNPDLVKNLREGSDNMGSDHTAINFTIPISCKYVKQPKRTIYNFKCADWAGLTNSLNTHSWDTDCNIDIDILWDNWSSSFFDYVDKYIPKIQCKSRSSAPWIDSDIIKLVKKKERAWIKFKKTGNVVFRDRFCSLRKQSKSLIKQRRADFLTDVRTSLKDNPKRFWSFHKIKNPVNIPQSVGYNDVSTDDPVKQANLFNNFFHSVFRDKASYTSCKLDSHVHDNLNNLSSLIFTSLDVYEVLSTVDPGKASGPDGIPGKLLRECALEISPALTAIFNASLLQGKVPSAWKRANVTPVFKKGDKSCVENYRPISLLSLVSKVLERCIHKKVLPFLQPIISDCQHGFMPNRSCVTQLVDFTYNLGSNYDRGFDTDVVYLDFSKAFDSVNHSMLIEKLRCAGIGGTLLAWFHDYLEGRLQRVVINGAYSEWLPVTSGVPQGSILGPLLFVIFINDMPSCVSSDTEISLFADDSKCSRIISTIADQLALQKDLNALFNWSVKWDIDFNAKKCVMLHVKTRKHHHVAPFNYKLGDHSLQSVDDQNDLGISVTCNMNWKPHINHMICKANRILGLIRHTCHDINDPLTRKILYLAHVRPILEYGSEIWNPQEKGLISSIEKVQRRATRFILRSSAPYEERLNELNLLSLDNRRKFKDNILLFKGLQSMTFISFHDKINFRNSEHHNLRSTNSPTIIPNRCRTNIFRQTYFNRIYHSWNALPANLRNLHTFPQFKSCLLDHYLANNT
jgi:hypothetical protein